MSAASTTQSSEQGLEVYRVRDDLARRYNPADSFERMLVTQLAQCWIRLQEAYDVERRYREGRDMLVIITTKLAEFKAVAGFVRDCERSWNRVKENLEKAQRQRRRDNLSSPNARRAWDRPQAPRPEMPQPVPPSTPASDVTAGKRE